MADEPQPSSSCTRSVCPVCDKLFPMADIEAHVDRCLFLNSTDPNEAAAAAPESTTPNGKPEAGNSTTVVGREPKRSYSIFTSRNSSPNVGSAKRPRRILEQNGGSDRVNDDEIKRTVIDLSDEERDKERDQCKPDKGKSKVAAEDNNDGNVPLAERMRPDKLSDYIGQQQIIGKNTVLRTLFEKNSIPSMILWGPPGCGKTTLAHIIATHCKAHEGMRFVKLSATTSGVNDVKEAVKVAKNELAFKRKTIMFMDEIHRFNKLQQDFFLPHVENGTITLIGATTENPSYSLNAALLSRCRVIVLEKLSVGAVMKILERALPHYKTVLVENNNRAPDIRSLPFVPRMMISAESIQWLAEVCDGDARIGLNSLQLALNTVAAQQEQEESALKRISLDDIKEGIKKSHLLYDRKGDQHYELISALHKSIRASDDNAALYWCSRMLVSGEDPRYLVRRMIRMASEDIGLADPNALTVATSTQAAVQAVGMPEADCIIAHCAVYLARAPKSREVYNAFQRCKASIEQFKGPMPGVPLHLRNASTKLAKSLNYGAGYNLQQKGESGLQYMPEGLEDEQYFSE